MFQALVHQHTAAPADKLTPCTDERVSAIYDSSRIYVDVVEVGYLRAASGAGGDASARDTEWVVSTSLRLPASQREYAQHELAHLRDQKMIAVVSLDPPSASPRAPKGLSGKITFHALPSGRGFCGASIPAAPPKKAGAPTEAQLRTAFIEAVNAKVGAMTPRLALRLESAAPAK